jgi:glutathione synthase/RimK-type ligase-like ATP-grasp enzyme
MRRRVALATYRHAPHLAPDDRALVPMLEALGVGSAPTVWNDDSVAWRDFDAVIVRSCWDYHRHADAFYGWLDTLAAAGVPVWNSQDVLRWNSHKSYLHDLAARGVPAIPSLRITGDDLARLDALLAEREWTRLVVKPCISASGYETHALRTPLDAPARATIARVTALGDALVQPFAEEIPRFGELSFVFLDGHYSHAALKRATGAEFRVQEEHGGTLAPFEPSDTLIGETQAVLAAVGAPLLYARVDGIVRDGRFMLMELELVEPNLFLAMRDGAAGDLAAAIVRRL